MPKLIDEEVVFTAVVELFITKGYENTTAEDLATAAGIHKATLFRKYGSKVNLVATALQHHLSLANLDNIQYTGDIQADLEEVVRLFLVTKELHAVLFPAVMTQVPQHLELKDVLLTMMSPMQKIAELIAIYQKAGLLQDEVPLKTVSYLIGPLISTLMFSRAMSSAFGSESTIPHPQIDPAEYVRSFLYGKSKILDKPSRA